MAQTDSNTTTYIEQKTASNTTVMGSTWLNRDVPKVKRTINETTSMVMLSEPSIECPYCHAITTRTAMSFNLYVCPNCDAHLKWKARDRLLNFFDEIYEEFGQEFVTQDPLQFVDRQAYPDRIEAAKQKTQETEALICMRGRIHQLDLVACAFEFDFMGGSMGSVVGDRFVAACNMALLYKIPLVCFAASGGARMQEGLLSLMQMARTAAAIQKLKNESIPYIVVHTNPVYGGVSASLAMLGDIQLAEPKAMVGFAGKRVIEQTVRQQLGDEFQTAEFLLEHGAIDQIVHRSALKHTVERLCLKLLNR